MHLRANARSLLSVRATFLFVFASVHGLRPKMNGCAVILSNEEALGTHIGLSLKNALNLNDVGI